MIDITKRSLIQFRDVLLFDDCRFFQILSYYSTEMFALLACQLEGPIRKAFFLSMPCDSMRQKMFSCDFLRFVDISFHFVYISRCVTHSVQRVLVKNFISYQRFNLQS